jgi:hypothetical protein
MAFWNKKKPDTKPDAAPDTEPLRKNAELVLEMIADLTASPAHYDAAALEWLDGYIQRMKAAGGLDEPARDRLLGMFGCFLGECCIRAYGGSWAQVKGDWQVVFDAKNSANPIDRASKCHDEGLEASLKSFFNVLGEIRAGKWR